jgi:putative endonuclease
MKRADQHENGPIVRPARTAAQVRGDAAEARACDFLSTSGLRLLAQNVRCRGGEIDLICLDRDILVFVEVRRRASARFGSAAESITMTKRQRIILAARWWLNGAGRRHANRACRFDALLFDGPDVQTPNWIRHAFELD